MEKRISSCSPLRVNLICTTVGVVCILWAAGIAHADPLGTSFTYQGQLKKDGVPVNNECNLTFDLYDAAEGGILLGTHFFPLESIEGGLFTVVLNENGEFGPDAFNGDRRWLEIAVHCAQDEEFVLTPRQELTPTPYAHYARMAGSAPWDGLTGVPAGFADGEDNDTTYTAGAGLALSETDEFSLIDGYQLPQSCANDQVPKWEGAEWVCADDADSGSIPSGIIVMWSGTTKTIPAGWALCDGTNGTPDLQEKFVYGILDSEEAGTIGGSTEHTHSAVYPAGDRKWRVHYNQPYPNTGCDCGDDWCLDEYEPSPPPFYIEDERATTERIIAQPGPPVGSLHDPGTCYPNAHTCEPDCGQPRWLVRWHRAYQEATSIENHLPTYYKLAFIMKL